MNMTRANLVVMSHLSDAQELMCGELSTEANKHINFAKYIIFYCKGNLNQVIDADELWAEFIMQTTKKIYG